ncbi:O-antigen ligase family protein [Metabacillus idriensis]|uniref:O-antigen ligase family protein n=1 Tax=Metabacillus idriensis TaxID=324768 RepID=UPI00174E0944|nr:O-antigen ligase family protein [Metabacillus idriensis]
MNLENRKISQALQWTSLILFFLFFFQIQFSISRLFINALPIPTPAVITSAAVLGLFFVYVMTSGKEFFKELIVKNSFYIFLALFTLSLITSTLSAFYTNTVLFSVEYQQYISSSLYTRFIYYGAYLSVVMLGLAVVRKLSIHQVKRIVKIYPITIYLLIIVGIWQFFYFTYNVPFLDIDTRSFVHSSEGPTLFDFRLTSFADEPSYLGPILIDFLILGMLVFRKWYTYIPFILIPAGFILLFSFSLSAYANIVMLIGFLVVLLIFHKSFPKKLLVYLAVIGLIFVGAAFVFANDLMMDFFNPIVGRFSTLFDFEHHSRMYMYVMPFFWLFDHSLVSALFGYGPGSFEFLAQTKILPSIAPVAISSNNMYIDILFEHGVIGFLMVLTGLILVFVTLVKHYKKNRYYFIALMLYVHLLITSLYRADFVTPRFWGILLIVSMLTMLGSHDFKHKSSKKLED